ncbi:unnamed protein product [Ceutorhynchus assimilis]|uniref:Ribonucleoside-diphosphate reductase n=1 Tax=Ceutorhynchus assimilis TaxID=467358 RepID=A0A9N9N224_9CUCU|nr:unnamed protein product [Ceutorhynchus assimilis]
MDDKTLQMFMMGIAEDRRHQCRHSTLLYRTDTFTHEPQLFMEFNLDMNLVLVDNGIVSKPYCKQKGNVPIRQDELAHFYKTTETGGDSSNIYQYGYWVCFEQEADPTLVLCQNKKFDLQLVACRDHNECEMKSDNYIWPDVKNIGFVTELLYFSREIKEAAATSRADPIPSSQPPEWGIDRDHKYGGGPSIRRDIRSSPHRPRVPRYQQPRPPAPRPPTTDHRDGCNMAYEELIRNALISVSFKYPKYKTFTEELVKGTAGKAEKWQLVLGSISQTKSGKVFCDRIITDLWDTFTKEMYVDANGHIFNAKLMDAIAADPVDWNRLERFNRTFEQKFVFLTRYALQYEWPEFMYSRVALFTHSIVSETLHFTVDEFYEGLVQQDFSPSGQILRHIGTKLSTESCAVLREFRQKSCTEDHQTIKQLRSTENIEHYKFLADCMSAPNRNIVSNFNQSIADVRVLEVLLKSNSMSANVDRPSNHLFTIGILDDFMMAVRQNTAWGMFATDDEIYSSAVYRKMKGVHRFAKTITARGLMNVICQRILANGKPSIIFLDHMNKFSQFPNSQKRPIGSSNLCTEITLHMKDDECATCCVGTLNVKKICKKLPIRCTDIDLDALNTKIAMLVDILNTTQATSRFEYSLKYRPLAIGLLGFSDTFSTHENNA